MYCNLLQIVSYMFSCTIIILNGVCVCHGNLWSLFMQLLHE
jgi:hypothetical protein